VTIAGLAALVSGVAASAAPTGPSAAGRASTPKAPAAARVDHQLCYSATGRIKVPNNVVLFNQFAPKGFKPKLGKVTAHCNPVVKILPSGTAFPVTNPRAHLLCITLAAPKQASHQVIVTNQFGSDGLITGQPNLLCLPSWKSLTGPPNQKKPQPPGLSHFTCYPVRLAPGAKGYPNVPAFVHLKDEFVKKPVRAKVSDIPNELCLPTKKVIGKSVTAIVNPRLHLLCFPVSPTPNAKKVWDQNQFGTQVLRIGKTTTLCLPSIKRVIVPVDHQLCYTVAGKYKVPPNIELKNQFSPKGFKARVSPAAVIHCNPVIKTLPTGQVFGVTNPRAHLLCYKMAAAKQPTPTVVVNNQFGSATLIPGQPNLLCLPSWKSLKGPPKQSAPQPPGLSHFTCYPVTLPAGTGGYQPPNPITLRDEFAPKPVQVQVSPVPQELCLPTEKIIGHTDSKIVNAITHLLCFPVTKTPIVPRIWDQNQFGTAKLAVRTTKWLCVPSTKRVVVTTP